MKNVDFVLAFCGFIENQNTSYSAVTLREMTPLISITRFHDKIRRPGFRPGSRSRFFTINN